MQRCCPVAGPTRGPMHHRAGVVVPRGYMARLEQVHDGRMIGFGPFVGYYFRPEDPRDLSRLKFVCFNENRFYSSDMPDGAKLYEGTAVRATLPQADITIPAQERINPVFFRKRPRPGATRGRASGTSLSIFTARLQRCGTSADRILASPCGVLPISPMTWGTGREREPTVSSGPQRAGPGLRQDHRIRPGARKGRLNGIFLVRLETIEDDLFH